MKKTAKIIALALAGVILACAAGISVAAYTRGYIKNEELTPEFSAALQQVEAPKNPQEVRIMSSNLLVHYKSWGGTDARPRAKMFFEMLNTYAPDVVGLQEMSDQWYSCIMQNKGSYKMLFPASTGVLVRMTSMIYNTETLNLIDKGQFAYEEGDNPRLRRAVWGVFEHKETGEKFAAISTHFDLIREGREEEMLAFMQSQAKQITELSDKLKEEYGVPVFCIGDFNSMNDSTDIMSAPSIYNDLADKLTDAKDIAPQKLSGDALGADEPTWDHIFMNGDAEISRFAVLSPAEFEKMSDHFPIFADVKL